MEIALDQGNLKFPQVDAKAKTWQSHISELGGTQIALKVNQ